MSFPTFNFPSFNVRPSQSQPQHGWEHNNGAPFMQAPHSGVQLLHTQNPTQMQPQQHFPTQNQMMHHPQVPIQAQVQTQQPGPNNSNFGAAMRHQSQAPNQAQLDSELPMFDNPQQQRWSNANTGQSQYQGQAQPPPQSSIPVDTRAAAGGWNAQHTPLGAGFNVPNQTTNANARTSSFTQDPAQDMKQGSFDMGSTPSLKREPLVQSTVQKNIPQPSATLSDPTCAQQSQVHQQTPHPPSDASSSTNANSAPPSSASHFDPSIFDFGLTGDEEEDTRRLTEKLAELRERGRQDRLAEMQLGVGVGVGQGVEGARLASGSGDAAASGPSLNGTAYSSQITQDDVSSFSIAESFNASNLPNLPGPPRPEFSTDASSQVATTSQAGPTIMTRSKSKNKGKGKSALDDAKESARVAFIKRRQQEAAAALTAGLKKQNTRGNASERAKARKNKGKGKQKQSEESEEEDEAPVPTTRNPCPLCNRHLVSQATLKKHIRQKHGPRLYRCTRENCVSNRKSARNNGEKDGQARIETNRRHLLGKDLEITESACIRSVARRAKNSVYWQKLVAARQVVNACKLELDPDLPADQLLRTDFSLGELKSMRVLAPIVREFDKGVEAWLRYPSTRPDLKDHWAWLGLEARSEGKLTKAEFQFVLDVTKRPGLRVWTGLKKEVERLVKTHGYASEEPDVKAVEWRSMDETWIDDGQGEDDDAGEDLSDLSDFDD